MTEQEKRGALLFFGAARCSTCHSVAGQSNEMFSDFQDHVIGIPQIVRNARAGKEAVKDLAIGSSLIWFAAATLLSVVSIGQGGLGLPNRDYYLGDQFADKKAAYLTYIAQILNMIGWAAPQDFAAAILAWAGACVIEAARTQLGPQTT